MTQILTTSVEEELLKNPELKRADIDHLNEWCKRQPHLPAISDSDLIIFLHSNYYCIEPTKKTIDSYYTLKTQFTEFFKDRDPLGNKSLCRMFYKASAIPLKIMTKEGYHIILSRLMDTDSSNYIFNNSIKFLLMAFELWLFSSGTIQGHVLLFDLQNATAGHCIRISLTAVKKFFSFLQDALPVRLKAMHFINPNPAALMILRLVKPFLRKAIADTMFIHSAIEDMGKYLPIEALPNEVGGKAGPIMELHEAEIKKIEAHREWFLDEQLRARVDESKRPKKVKSTTKGLEPASQSFNKLDID